MGNPNRSHLTQDQLMQAAFDEARLSNEVREHLTTCSACKEQKTKLFHRLGNLKTLSNRISTQSRPWYHLSGSAGNASSTHPFGLKFMLIIGVLAALIFILNRYVPFNLNSDDTDASSENSGSAMLASLDPIDPLPEIYAGLTYLSEAHPHWWQKDGYINGLRLTPSEIDKLESAWAAAYDTHLNLKKKLYDGQVDLAMALENKALDQAALQHRYQLALQNFAHLTEQRFALLLKFRNILGYERFQVLLKLHNK